MVKCGRRNCRKSQALIKRKPFYKILLSITGTLRVIYHLSIGDKAGKFNLLYGIDKKAVRMILLSIGEIVKEYNSTIKIGGPNKIVEVDESKLGKRKYNRAHRVAGSWVVGGVERTAERRIFL